MESVLASRAGLLALINPGVVSVLPIALASGLNTVPRAPQALAAELNLSFVGFGTVMTLPALGRRFASVSAG